MIEQIILGAALFVCGFIIGRRVERDITEYSLRRAGIERGDEEDPK